LAESLSKLGIYDGRRQIGHGGPPFFYRESQLSEAKDNPEAARKILGPPRRCRGRQGNGQRITTQDHQGDKPPNSLLGIGVDPEQFRHVPNGCRFRLDLLALAPKVGTFGLEVSEGGPSRCRRPESSARALRCPSIAASAGGPPLSHMNSCTEEPEAARARWP
jgi:hypothetical protein